MILKRALAVIALNLIYRSAVAISWLLSKLIGPRASGKRYVMLIGTFHNPNWMRAHVRPILDANDGNVLLVCDDPVAEFDGLTYVCPPKTMSRIFSRAVAKFFVSAYTALKYRPYLVMGYHIFPAGVTSLLVARLVRAYAGYQVTAGQLELEGGGWNAENVLLRMLGKSSRTVERSASALVRGFDLVVVRGSRAEAYVKNTGFGGALRAITGSAEVPESAPTFDERSYDVVFVGRLAEYKRPDRLLHIVSLAKDQGTVLRTLIIGEGPEGPSLKKLAMSLGVDEQIEWAGKIEDVPSRIRQAKVFVLTSRWEGLSIALLEAMTAGCVPVVSDVGDLRDAVTSGKNGFVFDGDDFLSYSQEIADAARDEDRWCRFSDSARETGIALGAIHNVSGRWREEFDRIRAQ